MPPLEPNFLVQVLALAAVVVPILVGVFTYQRGNRNGVERGREQGRAEIRQIEPNPLVVKEHPEFVKVSHCTATHKHNDDHHVEFFARLRDTERDISTLDERTQNTDRKLVLMDQKLDRLIERVKA